MNYLRQLYYIFLLGTTFKEEPCLIIAKSFLVYLLPIEYANIEI